MQNYKVEVKSKEEQLEAVDLFIKYGYERKLGNIPSYLHSFVCTDESGEILISSICSGERQITLQELRAMVSVQKYEELAKKYDGVKTKQLPNGIQFKKSKTSVTIYPSTGTIVSDVCGKINVLKKAGIGKLDHEMNKHFSVITPKQKEYLVKTDTGYVLQVLSDVVDGHDGIIEVPDGAMSYWECDRTSVNFFLKLEGGCHFYHYLNKNSKWALWNDADFKTFEMKWQRESLNDKVASAEEYRKSFTHTPKATLDVINNMQNAFEKAQNAINVQNAMAKLLTYPQYLSGVVHGKEFIVKPNQKKYESKLVDGGQKIIDGFTQPEELPFVSDTQQTLNERQSQYGDFKDVAGMTQELLAVMEQYGYSDMPKPHKEALHMICSKMARIVNGDHNHLDSWHDIGGYAKLIENNIK